MFLARNLRWSREVSNISQVDILESQTNSTLPNSLAQFIIAHESRRNVNREIKMVANVPTLSLQTLATAVVFLLSALRREPRTCNCSTITHNSAPLLREQARQQQDNEKVVYHKIRDS